MIIGVCFMEKFVLYFRKLDCENTGFVKSVSPAYVKPMGGFLASQFGRPHCELV